jgi:hypothetical protein
MKKSTVYKFAPGNFTINRKTINEYVFMNISENNGTCDIHFDLTGELQAAQAAQAAQAVKTTSKVDSDLKSTTEEVVDLTTEEFVDLTTEEVDLTTEKVVKTTEIKPTMTSTSKLPTAKPTTAETKKSAAIKSWEKVEEEVAAMSHITPGSKNSIYQFPSDEKVSSPCISNKHDVKNVTHRMKTRLPADSLLQEQLVNTINAIQAPALPAPQPMLPVPQAPQAPQATALPAPQPMLPVPQTPQAPQASTIYEKVFFNLSSKNYLICIGFFENIPHDKLEDVKVLCNEYFKGKTFSVNTEPGYTISGKCIALNNAVAITGDVHKLISLFRSDVDKITNTRKKNREFVYCTTYDYTVKNLGEFKLLPPSTN